jgi:hypothetical protein
VWWDKKKRQLQEIRDKARAAEERKRNADAIKAENIRQRKVRKRMGCLKYYVCYCLRDKVGIGGRTAGSCGAAWRACVGGTR